jgi:protein-tyrosine-phosphatase
MPDVLFVCTGNICRSPMAETVLRSELIERTTDGYWQVRSAGLNALGGAIPTDEAIQAMKEFGYNVIDHRARRLTRGDAEAANLILVMTYNHRKLFKERFPEHADRVHLLSEMVGQRFDISDPYGGSLMTYRNTAAQIIQLVKDGYTNIIALARFNSH